MWPAWLAGIYLSCWPAYGLLAAYHFSGVGEAAMAAWRSVISNQKIGKIGAMQSNEEMTAIVAIEEEYLQCRRKY